MHIRDFDFHLPQALIAQEPLPERDASRLLVLERATGRVRHQVFRDLPELLNPGDLVVVNRSRVIPARLLARRPSGEPAEILLVRAVDAAVWDALLRPGRRIRAGDRLSIAPGFDALVLETHPSADGRRRLELRAQDGDWRAAIERHGHVPLPPYVERGDTPADRERYQSVYAREAGSVAAPTAGLHFTPALLSRLAARGIEQAEIVLHVGPGTFRPVKVDDVSQHTVGPEAFEIPRETAAAISKCRTRGGRVVCVGTTTTRTLESAATSPSMQRPAATILSHSSDTRLPIGT